MLIQAYARDGRLLREWDVPSNSWCTFLMDGAEEQVGEKIATLRWREVLRTDGSPVRAAEVDAGG